MATGESRFNFNARPKQQVNLMREGTYMLRLRPNLDIRVASGVGKVPRVAAQFELVNPEEAGGGSKLLFADFFCDLTPGKDGVAMVDRAGGIVEFVKAGGFDEPDFSVIQREVETADGSIMQEYLDPDSVLTWLKGIVGAEVRGKVGKEEPKEGSGYGPKNRVKWLPKEA